MPAGAGAASDSDAIPSSARSCHVAAMGAAPSGVTVAAVTCMSLPCSHTRLRGLSSRTSMSTAPEKRSCRGSTRSSSDSASGRTSDGRRSPGAGSSAGGGATVGIGGGTGGGATTAVSPLPHAPRAREKITGRAEIGSREPIPIPSRLPIFRPSCSFLSPSGADGDEGERRDDGAADDPPGRVVHVRRGIGPAEDGNARDGPEREVPGDRPEH